MRASVRQLGYVCLLHAFLRFKFLVGQSPKRTQQSRPGCLSTQNQPIEMRLSFILNRIDVSSTVYQQLGNITMTQAAAIPISPPKPAPTNP